MVNIGRSQTWLKSLNFFKRRGDSSVPELSLAHLDNPVPGLTSDQMAEVLHSFLWWKREYGLDTKVSLKIFWYGEFVWTFTILAVVWRSSSRIGYYVIKFKQTNPSQMVYTFIYSPSTLTNKQNKLATMNKTPFRTPVFANTYFNLYVYNLLWTIFTSLFKSVLKCYIDLYSKLISFTVCNLHYIVIKLCHNLFDESINR